MNERVDTAANCQKCGQPCGSSYNLCTTCHYADLEHEGIVVGAVLRYFSSAKFETFSTKREYEIPIGSSPCRADVILRDRAGKLVVVAECKKIGFAGERGMAQLEDYLNHSDAQFGLFAADTDRSAWSFWKKDTEGIDEITPYQFEIEIIGETERDRHAIPEGIQVEINRLENQKSELQTKVIQLEGKVQSLVSRETKQRKNVERLKGNEHELNVSIQSQEAKHNRLRTEIDTLIQTERNIQASNESLEVKTNQISNRKSELEIEVEHLENLKSRLHRWQPIIIPLGIVGIVLVFSLGTLFLMQRNATEDANHQNTVLVNQLTQKGSEIRQKDQEIQTLTTSIQTLESESENLSEKISGLENQLKNKKFRTNTTSGSMVSLRRQLNEQKGENQKLQNQLLKKDDEIRQLRNDKAIALSENRKLQSQSAGDKQGITNQNATVRQLQSENKTLQNQSQDLAHQNQKLRNENKVLRYRLDNVNGSNSDQSDKLPNRPDNDQQTIVSPQPENLVAEPPEQIQDIRETITRARSHNNQGCFEFERNDYDEAAKQFEQAIKTDSKFAVAHYNLGCVYLEMKKHKKAVDAFDEAASLDRKFKEAHYNLGLARFRIKTFQSAKQAVEKALSIDPNYQLAQELLTEIENTQQ